MTSQSVDASPLTKSQARSTHDGSTLLSVGEVRSRIVEESNRSARIELGSALGRALAEDVVASRAHPPAAVAAMDGYATSFRRRVGPSSNTKENRGSQRFSLHHGASKRRDRSRCEEI